MQLESTLAQFPLPELMRMIVGSSVTGCLELGDVASGRMYFRDGQLYHAVSDAHTGLAAVCQFFALPDVPFRFTAGVISDSETLWQDIWDVIETAQHYAEVWQRVRGHVPNFAAIPVLVPIDTNSIAINEQAWRTLAMIDGKRSVDAIAEQLGQVPIEVAAALCDLIEQGAVQLLHIAPHVQRPEPVQLSRGFFSRLLAMPYAYEKRP